MDEVGDKFSAIGALADPVRRRLYGYVTSCTEAVGREEAAEAAGVPVHSARFHLDRLVEEGLLEVEFRRLSGRSGPGAGRPAKLYRRSNQEVAVSLPGRSYDLVGGVLAAAVDRSLAGESLPDALAEEARAAGRQAAAAHEGAGDELDRAAAVLAGEGYEPSRGQAAPVDDLELRNCPFDSLAREHPELVCGINLEYVGGVLDGLRCRHANACLDPAPDRCCVRIRA